MLYNIEKLIGQVHLLKKLSRQPATVGWVHEAIKEAASEIERTCPQDIAADYAREIRSALDRLSSASSAPAAISGSNVGEKILALEQYTHILQQQYLPEDTRRLYL